LRVEGIEVEEQGEETETEGDVDSITVQAHDNVEDTIRWR
jgi:hypothetical protein